MDYRVPNSIYTAQLPIYSVQMPINRLKAFLWVGKQLT